MVSVVPSCSTNPGRSSCLEAAEFRDDAVATGNELRREVAAVCAADRLTKDPGIFVREDDGDAWQYGAVSGRRRAL